MVKKSLISVGVVALATASSIAAWSGPASAQPSERGSKAYAVTAAAKKAEVILGKKVKIVGKVSPKAVGKVVKLQQRTDPKKKWRNQRTAKVRKNGTFKLKDKPTTVAARFYRVVKPGDRKRRKGVSKPIEVTMFRWLDLGKQTYRASSQMWWGDATMNLVEYPNSLIGVSSATTGFRDYNLGKRCTRFTATVGLSDSSNTDSVSTLWVKNADTVIFSQPFTFTEYQEVSLPIDDVFRLAVGFDQAAESAGVPAFGSPKVLCSF